MGLLWDLYTSEDAIREDKRKMEHVVITISRAYGSGGSMIGKNIAEKLGIAYFDRNLIDKIAHERGLDKAYIPNWREDSSSLYIWGADDPSAQVWNLNYWKSGSPYYSSEKEMFCVQSKIICELAKAGPCVFVGRCADFVMKDRKRCLRIWIGTDEDSRRTRLYDEYWVRNGNLTEKIRIVDKGRASYYRRCTGQLWGEHNNYHINLDSGALGMGECTRIVCSSAEKFGCL